jgi:hypothetical protein
MGNKQTTKTTTGSSSVDPVILYSFPSVFPNQCTNNNSPSYYFQCGKQGCNNPVTLGFEIDPYDKNTIAFFCAQHILRMLPSHLHLNHHNNYICYVIPKKEILHQ